MARNKPAYSFPNQTIANKVCYVYNEQDNTTLEERVSYLEGLMAGLLDYIEKTK